MKTQDIFAPTNAFKPSGSLDSPKEEPVEEELDEDMEETEEE